MVSIIPQTFWQFSFAVVPGQVLISSLLKNSFGSSFRCALRHGISLFVGFWRGGILYSVRDGVFRSLFQQPVSRVTEHWEPAPRSATISAARLYGGQQGNCADKERRSAARDAIVYFVFRFSADRNPSACIDIGDGVWGYVMSAAANGIFHAVGKLTNAVRSNHLAVAEVQIGRLGRIFDLEGKSKRDFRLPERSYQVAADHEMPLTNRLHRRLNKKWVTGNGLQFGDGIVFTNYQEEFHFPLSPREPSFPRVNGTKSI